MNNPIEMEKKFRVLSNDLDSFLKSKKFISSKRVVDEYLDTPEGRFYKNGIYIRVRNQKSLDIKFNPEHLGALNVTRSTICHEYNISLPFDISSIQVFDPLEKMINLKCPNSYTFENFSITNNLKPIVVLDKNRSTYEDEMFIIAVDEFSDFGTFIEFEAKDNTIPSDVFLNAVEQITQNLDLQEFNSGYIELRLREINPTLYLKGKYLIKDMAV